MERHEFESKPRTCPNCGSSRIADILYGLPYYSEELERDIEAGRIVLGGCLISENNPSWICADCHTPLFRKGGWRRELNYHFHR